MALALHVANSLHRGSIFYALVSLSNCLSRMDQQLTYGRVTSDRHRMQEPGGAQHRGILAGVGSHVSLAWCLGEHPAWLFHFPVEDAEGPGTALLKVTQ